MAGKPLTDKQDAIYKFIRWSILEKNASPTVREIGEEFNIRSTNGVMCHVRAIERKGWIKRDPFLSRGITLVPEPVSQIVRFEVDETLTIGPVTINLMSVVKSSDDVLDVMVEIIAPDTMGEVTKGV